MQKTIGIWLRNILAKRWPSVEWRSGMTAKQANYQLRRIHGGHCHYYIARDDNNKFALYETD